VSFTINVQKYQKLAKQKSKSMRLHQNNIKSMEQKANLIYDCPWGLKKAIG